MKRPRAVFLCAPLLASMAACHRAPELRPRLILQGEPVGNEFLLAAPYVLAVRITDAKLRGEPEAIAPGGPKVPSKDRANASSVRFV